MLDRLPVARGRDRRRRHRLRVRLDLRRPRREGDDPGGSAEDPSRARRRRRRRRGPRLVQEARHRHQDRRDGHRPHAQRGRAARRCTSATASRSRSTPSSCRSGAARSPTCSASTGTAVDRRPSAASSRSTSTAALPSRASTPSATSSTHRSWPTSGTPRRSWRSRTCSASRPMPVAVRPGAVGHLLPPRGGLRRPLARRRRGRRPSTWSSPSTSTGATAGPRSSARPKAW